MKKAVRTVVAFEIILFKKGSNVSSTKTTRGFHKVALCNSVVSFRCIKPQRFHLSISYHLFDQNL